MAERYLANSSSDGIIPSGGGGSFKVVVWLVSCVSPRPTSIKVWHMLALKKF